VTYTHVNMVADNGNVTSPGEPVSSVSIKSVKPVNYVVKHETLQLFLDIIAL
jgi:hypothetical protein